MRPIGYLAPVQIENNQRLVDIALLRSMLDRSELLVQAKAFLVGPARYGRGIDAPSFP